MSSHKRWFPPVHAAHGTTMSRGFAWIAAIMLLVTLVAQSNGAESADDDARTYEASVTDRFAGRGATEAGATGNRRRTQDEELGILVDWHISASRGYGLLDHDDASFSR